MNERLIKYAKVLLNTCLKVEKDKPLFISYDKEVEYFIDIVVKEAKLIGIEDIYLEGIDSIKKHDLLLTKEVEEIKDLPYWNKSIWNEYTKKDAAFLMIATENPGLMDDVDINKIQELNQYSMTTRKYFDDARDKSRLAWCIACAPNERWAKEIFPDSLDPVKDTWDAIFKLCLIDQDNPEELWKEKMDILTKRAEILNNYQFKKLIYKSSKTDFTIELPDNHLWQTGYELLENGKQVIVNFPTEEIFTSPDRLSANGIVYNTKPLYYNNTEIDNFYIEFKDGKATKWHAYKGEDMLGMMINVANNSDYLGEVAIVSNDSPISNSNIVFKETLFDENASCHIALGNSFPECIKNGTKMSKSELYELGLNDSLSHVDFMIGSKELNIIGITKDEKRIPILIDGNFSDIFRI